MKFFKEAHTIVRVEPHILTVPAYARERFAQYIPRKPVHEFYSYDGPSMSRFDVIYWAIVIVALSGVIWVCCGGEPDFSMFVQGLA